VNTGVHTIGYDPHIDRKYNLIPLFCTEMGQTLALIVKEAVVAPIAFLVQMSAMTALIST